MALAVVGHAGAYQSSGTTLVLTYSSTAGNLLLVAFSAYNGSLLTSISSITDSSGSGNNWTKVKAFDEQQSATHQDAEIWTTTVASPAAVTSITINMNNNTGYTGVGAYVLEISGANNSSPIDQTAAAGNLLASPASGATATLGASNELAVGVIGYARGIGGTLSALTFTQGVPSTALPSTTTWQGSSSGKLNVSYLVITSTTGQGLSGTVSSNALTSAVIAVIKAAAASANKSNFLLFFG